MAVRSAKALTHNFIEKVSIVVLFWKLGESGSPCPHLAHPPTLALTNSKQNKKNCQNGENTNLRSSINGNDSTIILIPLAAKQDPLIETPHSPFGKSGHPFLSVPSV